MKNSGTFLDLKESFLVIYSRYLAIVENNFSIGNY